MTTLWLSTTSIAPHEGRYAIVHQVAGLVAGFHIDVTARDVRMAILERVRRLPNPLPFDLHFLDSRDDQQQIADGVASANPRLRHVYSPALSTGRPAWSLSGTAREFSRGENSPSLCGRHRILITAPSARHPPHYRIGVVQSALTHIGEHAAPDVQVVLDRDVSAALARIPHRHRIAEIVVGKAILESADPRAAALAIKESWGME